MKPQNSRRVFLKTSFLSSAVVVLGGCSSFNIVTLKDTIAVVQSDLFPKAEELNINTVDYINIIIRHSRITKEDKDFLRDGVKWLNEEAIALHERTYIKLQEEERQNILALISQEAWGESWIHTMMTYIFEAMLGDPIYGSNIDEAGWNWLSFQGGLPSPKKAFL